MYMVLGVIDGQKMLPFTSNENLLFSNMCTNNF